MSQEKRILVSICIPTYNGAATVAETLDSILSQARDDLEVLVCDDCSTDDTPEIANAYALRHQQVRVIRKDSNVGMDRNFARAALHCRGEYVWFCGQDDVLEMGAIDKCWEILCGPKPVDFIYFNYRFMNGELTRVVKDAFLGISEDRYFASPEEYFSEIDHCPTFLPSVVMRRWFWDITPYEVFFGTHYVQVGVWLYNFAGHNTYVVADPFFITGRIPEDSWKRNGGQMLFEIFSGNLDVYQTVFRSERNTIPVAIYRKAMRRFLWNLPHYTVFFSEKGFRCTPLIEARMKKLFGENFLLYWFYVRPLTHMPVWGHVFLRAVYRTPVSGWILRTVRRGLGKLAQSARI
jgi:glycosyltransferase involved in cell wall biosynthesis